MTTSTHVEERGLRARRSSLEHSFSSKLRLALLATIAGSLSAFAAPAYADDARYTFPRQFQISPKGVNLQTGLFTYTAKDLTIGNLMFSRTWGDQPPLSSNGRSLGIATQKSRHWTGWTHSFNIGVVPRSTSSTTSYVVYINGRQTTFKVLADGNIVPADQAASGTNLVKSNGQWLFTDKTGDTYLFYAHPALDQQGYPGNPLQVVSRITYANGTTVDVSYNGSAQPRFVRSSLGYAMAFDYDGNQNLQAVCGFNLGRQYADTGTTCNGAALQARFGYDAAGSSLTSITDVLGHVVTLSYPASGNYGSGPSCISIPDSQTCTIQNFYGMQPGETGCCALPDQVRWQKTATGDTWQYLYDPQENPQDDPVVAGRPRLSGANMIDPETTGEVNASYDRGRLVNFYDGTGAWNFKYAERTLPVIFDDLQPYVLDYHDINPALVTHPEGDRDYYEHDFRGNVTLKSHWPKGAADPLLPNGSPAISQTDPDLANCCISPNEPVFPQGSVTARQNFLPDAGYTSTQGNTYTIGCGGGVADAKRCDKPIARIDALGYETDYSYDPGHGGVLTETGPADSNGVRPQTRYSYVQRRASVLAAGGGFTFAGDPIWLLASKSFCRTGSAASSGTGCANAGDEVVTTYDYGPDGAANNLLLRGMVEDATGVAARTCYAYDAQGNRIAETKPRAGLAVCQ